MQNTIQTFENIIDDNIDSEIELQSSNLDTYSQTGCGGVPCTQNAGCK